MKCNLFIILLMGIFSINLISASSFGYDDSNKFGYNSIIKEGTGTINNNYINNSYTNITIINGSYVPYQNATQDVNLGEFNLTTGNLLWLNGTIGNPSILFGNEGNLSFKNTGGSTFHLNHGLYIDGGLNDFLDIGSKLIVGTYARIAQYLSIGQYLNVTGNVNLGADLCNITSGVCYNLADLNKTGGSSDVFNSTYDNTTLAWNGNHSEYSKFWYNSTYSGSTFNTSYNNALTGNNFSILVNYTDSNYVTHLQLYDNITDVINRIFSIGNWTADKVNYNTTIENQLLFANYSIFTNCSIGTVIQNLTSTGAQCIAFPTLIEADPFFIAENTSLARIGTCPEGQVIQNATTAGVQCVTPVVTTAIIPYMTLQRTIGHYVTNGTNGTAFLADDMQLPSVIGTPTPNTTVDTSRAWIRFATAATINTMGGQTEPYGYTQRAYQPKYTSLVRTDVITPTMNSSIWVGLTSGVLTTSEVRENYTVTTLNFAAIGYSRNNTALFNGGNWGCCTGNGSGYNCTNMGMAVASNTKYTMIVDLTNSSQAACLVINDTGSMVSINRTIWLPHLTASLGIHNGITTKNATVKYYFISKGQLEQNY